MQSIQFLNDGRIPYLLVSCDGVLKDGYETQLFQIQKIPGFLQYEIREYNGKRNLYYPLKYHTSVKTILEHLPFTEFQIKNMLRSIINAIQTVEEYLLHFDRIVWKPEQIFMEVDTGNLEFCYNPIEKQDNGNLQEFLSEIISVAGKKNQESFLLLLEFYNLVTNPNYTVEQLLEYSKNWLEEKPAQLPEEDQGSMENRLSNEKTEKGKKEQKEEIQKEKVSVRIVRNILIAIVVVNMGLIVGLLCNLLTYHYIRYLLVGMVIMIVVTILYINVDKEDCADEIMQEYFANVQEEQNGFLSVEPIAKEITYNETTVLTAENENRVFCLMPVIKEQSPPIYIQKESVVVGCWKKGCDFVIEKSGVSRMHFKLIKREKEMYIMDLNSTNGTYLNGERLESGKEYKVEEGDIIAFARLEFFIILE